QLEGLVGEVAELVLGDVQDRDAGGLRVGVTRDRVLDLLRRLRGKGESHAGSQEKSGGQPKGRPVACQPSEDALMAESDLRGRGRDRFYRLQSTATATFTATATATFLLVIGCGCTAAPTPVDTALPEAPV